MAKSWILIAVLSVWGAAADDLPRPTQAGTEAMTDLFHRCEAAGGMRSTRDAGTGEPYYEVVDAGNLRAAIVANRGRITRPLVDALIGGWTDLPPREEPSVIALLRAIGEELKDARVQAFAALFAGQRAGRDRHPDEALVALSEAARRFSNVGDRGWQATALHESGRVQRSRGELGMALACYREALAIRLALYGEDHPLVATTRNNFGSALESLGDFRGAEEEHRRALRIREKLLPPNDPALAWSLFNLGHVEFLTGRYPDSLGHLRRALEIRRQHADEPGLVADVLNGLGVVLSEMGQLDEAARVLDEALTIWDRLGPGGEAGRADALNNLGVVYFRRGDFDRALDAQQRTLEIRLRNRGPRHPDVANSYSTLGRTHHELGDLTESLRCYERAFEILSQFFGNGNPDVARAINNAGGVYKDMGDPAKALKFYRVALAIWRRAYPGPHPDIAYCLDNIAVLQSRQGDHAEAISRHREAMEMLVALHGERHPEVANSLGGLAAACAAAGRRDEALVHFRRGLEIARQNHPDGHPAVAALLSAQAQVRADAGDRDGALRDYGEALAIARRCLGAAHPQVAYVLGQIAAVRRARDERSEAEAALREALSALRRPLADGANRGRQPVPSDFEPLPLSVELLTALGKVLEENFGPTPTTRQLAESAGEFEAAASVLEQLRVRYPHFEEASKLRLGEDAAEITPHLIGIRLRAFEASHDPSELAAAFTAAERGTARIFLEMTGRARALDIGKVTPQARAREAALLARLRHLDERNDAEQGEPIERRNVKRIGELSDQREHAREDWQQFVAQLEKDYPQYAAWKYPRPCSLEEARSCLAGDEVALLYVTGSQASYLIVVQHDGAPETAGLAVYRLPSADRIAAAVAALTRPGSLRVPRGLKGIDEPKEAAATRDQAAEAYRMLLAPAAAAIRGKGLVIVPGGPLGYLPFELLNEPDEAGAAGAPAKDRYLLEGHRIRYAPSLTNLRLVRLWEATRARPDRLLWAMGDPIYEATDPRLASRTEPGTANRDAAARYRDGSAHGSFERLPGSGLEVEQLGSLLGAQSTEVVVGRQATESTVKEQSRRGVLARYRFVHFATHGVLGLADGTPPALILSLVGDPGGEDGILRLDEVTGLRLNADSVVLSACQTARGPLFNAEGVMGLARAFLHAGSRSVVCSLWPVDDRETSTLMLDLYRNLQQDRSPADALRAAQLKQIDAGKPPLYWAPFILIGQ